MRDALRSALTFHASFDRGLDADVVPAGGDARLFTLINRKTMEARPGLHADGKTRRAPGEGKFGAALQFTSRDAPWVFYAGENLAYQREGWSGSASLWLRCDPAGGLADGYCDPVQFTPRAWNDAAFFLDFDKQGSPRAFRLGAFPDLAVWNPQRADVPESERPLLTAVRPGFALDRWTHVAFTWENFNSGAADGVAKLYIDGELNGALAGWRQQFTWGEDETVRLLLGLHYIGYLDDFACFDRALSAEEVAALFRLHRGVASLALAGEPDMPTEDGRREGAPSAADDPSAD